MRCVHVRMMAPAEHKQPSGALYRCRQLAGRCSGRAESKLYHRPGVLKIYLWSHVGKLPWRLVRRWQRRHGRGGRGGPRRPLTAAPPALHGQAARHHPMEAHLTRQSRACHPITDPFPHQNIQCFMMKRQEKCLDANTVGLNQSGFHIKIIVCGALQVCCAHMPVRLSTSPACTCTVEANAGSSAQQIPRHLWCDSWLQAARQHWGAHRRGSGRSPTGAREAKGPPPAYHSPRERAE